VVPEWLKNRRRPYHELAGRKIGTKGKKGKTFDAAQKKEEKGHRCQ